MALPQTYNFGQGDNVTPYPFQMPAGSGQPWDFSGINSYGMGGTPTLGANAAGTIAGATPKGFFDGSGLGMNLPTLQLGLDTVGKLGSLYAGISALGLAKDQFGFQKNMAEKNYTNSVSSYNTSLEDRANARASVDGSNAAAYIAAHKLT
jgi:hypothetical protein